jgi:hypothetical protein
MKNNSQTPPGILGRQTLSHAACQASQPPGREMCDPTKQMKKARLREHKAAELGTGAVHLQRSWPEAACGGAEPTLWSPEDQKSSCGGQQECIIPTPQSLSRALPSQ